MMTKVLYSVLGLSAAGFLAICDLCQVPGQATAAASIMPAVSIAAAEAANPKSVTLDVQGMTCGGCAVGVRTLLKRLPGVSKAEVSYETRRAVVTYDPGKVTVAQMIAAIETLKYKATVVPS